jgi:beta-lactamase class A
MYERRRRSKKRVGCIILLYTLILFLLCAFVTYRYYDEQNQRIVSPIPEDHTPDTPLLQIFRPEKNPDKLVSIVKETVGDAWDNYSVYVVDFKSRFSMGINESTIYSAASVNKVPILAALYAEAQKGSADLDRVITLQEQDRQDYGTGSIRYDPAGTEYSVKTLARLMMQKSDNTAAHLLANYIVGLDTVQSYINGWGMTQTDMVNNKTSNADMALLFKKIFDKQITSPALSLELLDLLKDSDFEDRLPALLPKDAVVYHKIGTGTGSVHDVGVVSGGKLTYYIGIFTSDITDEEQSSVLLSQVSKKVYDFMK